MHVSEGYCRLVFETSPDGEEPYDREVIARGDQAWEAAGQIRQSDEATLRCLADKVYARGPFGELTDAERAQVADILDRAIAADGSHDGQVHD